MKNLIFNSIQEVLNSKRQYKTIYADPPWPYKNQSTRSATKKIYKATMTLNEIRELPVINIVEDNAHLHLWTTNAFLFESKQIMEAWGFEYKSILLWVKPQMGIGNYWRVCHEFLLFGIRGKLPMDKAHKYCRSWQEASRQKHSEKPHLFRNLIEKVSYTPRIELFARKVFTGWDIMGNEIKDADLWIDQANTSP